MAELRTKYPQNFAGSSMNEDGEIGGTVEFTGFVPAQAAEVLADVPVPVELVGNAVVTEVEVRDAVEKTHYAMRAQVRSLSVSTSYNESTGAVETTIYGTPAEIRVLPTEALTSMARAAATSANPNFDALVGTAGSDQAGSETIRGGAILTFAGTNDLQCASGWPVRGTGGTTEGLITAEHCDGDFDYSVAMSLPTRPTSAA